MKPESGTAPGEQVKGGGKHAPKGHGAFPGGAAQPGAKGESEELRKERSLHEETKKALAEKSALLAEYEDLLKRKQADFENFRKRIQREAEENRKFATTSMILEVLDLLDNFERAVESTRSAKDFDALLEGLLIADRQFRSILEKKHGVKRIDALGQEFDPNRHDAILSDESADREKDTVVEDLQTGYLMHDRVIRPTKVRVARAAALAPQSGQNELSQKGASSGERADCGGKGPDERDIEEGGTRDRG